MQVQTDAKFVQKHRICRPDEKYLFKLYSRQASLDSFPRSGILPLYGSFSRGYLASKTFRSSICINKTLSIMIIDLLGYSLASDIFIAASQKFQSRRSISEKFSVRYKYSYCDFLPWSSHVISGSKESQVSEVFHLRAHLPSQSARGKQLAALLFFFLHNSGNVQDFCCTSFLIVIFFCGKEKLQHRAASQKLLNAHEGSVLLLALCRSQECTLQFFICIFIPI